MVLGVEEVEFRMERSGKSDRKATSVENFSWMRCKVLGSQSKSLWEVSRCPGGKSVGVAKLGGLLTTNCPESPETMSIIERSWRTIEELQ